MYEDLLDVDPPGAIAAQSPAEVAALVASLQQALRNSLRVSRSLAEHLQEAEQELEEVARLLSHDIRAPIRQFHSFASLLDALDEPLPEQADGYIGHLKDSTRELSERVDSVARAIRSRKRPDEDELAPGEAAEKAFLINGDVGVR